jgi:O-antigen ligase
MRPQRLTAFGWQRHLWLVGLVLAPLLFGSVSLGGQAVVGFIFGLGLLLAATDFGGTSKPLLPRPLAWLALVWLFLPLLSLPAELAGLLNPRAQSLAREFPLELGTMPAVLPLSLAPAATVQRLWELTLILAAFCLARHSAGDARFPRHFTFAVGVAIGLLAASDLAYRSGDPRSILGIWPLTWGAGAGTFANRNHFANWCVVGALFCAGWMLRSWQPLHGARSGASPGVRTHAREGQWAALAVLFALVMAVVSGSRGGLLALMSGLAVWLVLLLRRSRRRGRWIWVGAGAIFATLLLLAFGGTLLERLASVHDDLAGRYPKVSIWRDALALSLHFPVLGAGWGAFAAAFGHGKTFGGDLAFIHAENEYIQLLVEAGLAGTVVFALAMARPLRAVWKAAWSHEGRLPEPETFFAALAALAAFAAHAVVEFVFQIPSTAILAAALSGFVLGSLETARGQDLPPLPPRWRVVLNLLCGAALLAASVCAGLANTRWNDALDALARGDLKRAVEMGGKSLRLWPWKSSRQVAQARLRIQSLAGLPSAESRAIVPDIRRQLQAAIAADPLNWELRLERARLDLAWSTNATLALAEAREVVRLNPLLAQIPLHFARHFAGRDAERAWEFLEMADLSRPGDLRDALEIAWSLPGDKTRLWSLVPADDPEALAALGDFARDKNLLPLAAQAYQQLQGNWDGVRLARKFLVINRPELALAQLPDAPDTVEENLIASRAHLELGRYPLAIKCAEAVWTKTGVHGEVTTPYPATASASDLAREWRQGARDVSVARQLAEALFRAPAAQRDVTLLREVIETHPGELRVKWLYHRAEWERANYRAGAQAALELAERAAARQQPVRQ